MHRQAASHNQLSNSISNPPFLSFLITLTSKMGSRTELDIEAMKTTSTLEEMGIDSNNITESFISRCIAAQSFADYLTESDTDIENSTLPPSRRWLWYCKLPDCPKYYSAWTCKTNFLLHLYETPIHREDGNTKTREDRRTLARSWREETAYDLSEPKKSPPQHDDYQNGNK
ncbi:hypothetical protein P170DRAFT_447718 [Aspergillus steynii IBT 23096]|uniref:Uncharacterized protein n=1 Tax=Aspergillus steynii IBT 23096 TaxID=1392250 RepID=A0A2I2G4P1_9EURO|nr:uncharacterized protein P170DRAFT_447718 [Aspergillus steynii IBT 23096]PLB47850.1 hypothetical protein P170DRAFT_447718 [Aspergillus steynii IBT 23096]